MARPTRLPPGDYEIYNFHIFHDAGTVQRSFGSKQDFSIPFTIRRGGGTYIGEFLAVGSQGQNIFGMPLPAGGYCVVSNRGDRDIPIAKRKEPALRDVVSAVAGLRSVGNPIARGRRPLSACRRSLPADAGPVAGCDSRARPPFYARGQKTTTLQGRCLGDSRRNERADEFDVSGRAGANVHRARCRTQYR